MLIFILACLEAIKSYYTTQGDLKNKTIFMKNSRYNLNWEIH